MTRFVSVLMVTIVVLAASFLPGLVSCLSSTLAELFDPWRP
jgi:hypothetical protein